MSAVREGTPAGRRCENVPMSRWKTPPHGAFAEMLAADWERDPPPLGGWAGETVVPLAPRLHRRRLRS